jgi:hydrogenase 3 maturation protease
MLESLLGKLKGKVMLLGVGNTLRGDDGAGPYLIEQLKGLVDAILLDCGEVPENFLGKIAEAHPDTILIIDAIDLGANPGAVAILEEGELRSLGWSTHHAPLQLFINCVKTALSPQGLKIGTISSPATFAAEPQTSVLVLAIQPKSVDFGSKISEEVKATLQFLKDIIVRLL